ncbi:hypothetical protein ADUPG1_014837, partial [Aduncisulcus paluster]
QGTTGGACKLHPKRLDLNKINVLEFNVRRRDGKT